MSRMSRCWFLYLVVALVLAIPAAYADEDPASYRLSIKPGFELEGKNYARFESPIHYLNSPVDNMLISADIVRAPGASVRAYARFHYAKEATWSRYQEFESEFHFADVRTIDAYQVLFVMFDLNQGRSTVRQYNVQGRKLGEELMKACMAPIQKYTPAAAWSKPATITRAGWNARPPKGNYAAQTPQKLIMHHSWQPDAAHYNGATTIRGIQNYHMDDPKTGWADIGYHFLIGTDGVIYEGRPVNAVGAHCPPNTNMVGICVIGDYDPGRDKLNPKIEASIVNLMSWLSATYKIDPRTAYYGHRNFSSKSCPGDTVYNNMDKYREQVLKNIGEIKQADSQH